MNEEKLDKIISMLNECLQKLSKHDEKFEELDKRLDRVEERLDEHDKRFDNHENRLNSIENILNEHTKDIESIKRSLAIIEDAVTNKIPALFDAIQSNMEKHEEFDNRITKLENISDTNSLKISILEDTSKIHSKQLAKLSS